MRIVVPDLGLSNLWSARRALEALGHEVIATGDAGAVASAGLIVLPGVGAFAEAVRRLGETGIGAAIRVAAGRGAAVLGICLGMQLLFDSSEEGGESRGLGLLPGRITRLSGKARVPHVGWNRVVATPSGTPLFGNGDGENFYFVHSFVARPVSDDFVLARCFHGESFPAAVGRGALLGFQFQQLGQRIRHGLKERRDGSALSGRGTLRARGKSRMRTVPFLILPAIDLRDGHAVRLRQGQAHTETKSSSDPVEVARQFAEAGARALHVVDLDGAFSGAPVHLALVARICRATELPVRLGGGLRRPEDLEAAFSAGVR